MNSISRLVAAPKTPPPKKERRRPPPPPAADHAMATSSTPSFQSDLAETLHQSLREHVDICRSAGDKLLVASLCRMVRNRDIDLPALPEVVLRIREVLSSADPSPRALARALESDPALCGRFLSIANSPFYSRGHKIDSIPAAVVRIGMDRSAALTLAVVGKTRLYAGAKEDGQHAINTAVIAEHIAGLIGLAGPEAFIAGLLHDVGRRVLMDASRTIHRSTQGAKSVSPEAMATIMHNLHAGFSALAAAEWSFSENVVSAVQHHHLAQDGGMEAVVLIPEKSERLTTIVALADCMAHLLEGEEFSEAGQRLLVRVGIETPEQVLEGARATLEAFSS